MQPKELGTKKISHNSILPPGPCKPQWQPQSTSPHASTYFFLHIKRPDRLGSLWSSCNWTRGGVESTSALQQTNNRARHGTQPSCLVSAGNHTLPPLKLPTTCWGMQCCFMTQATSLFCCTHSWSQQRGLDKHRSVYWFSLGTGCGSRSDP